jgi:glycosidase
MVSGQLARQPHRRAMMMQGVATIAALASAQTAAADPLARVEAYATANDHVLRARMARREADWRVGALVYQIIVDRFAPSANLDAKKHHYAAPRRLRPWSENPSRGSPVPGAGVWSHELDFWGGDLASLESKLDYVEDLGVDVVYLNPIHKAFTNHKYDAQDYLAISPEYGAREDVRRLADTLHKRKMRLVLDGVFNHLGRTAPIFLEAKDNPQSPYRDWFYFGSQWTQGYRAWADVANLPDLNWENPAVRRYFYEGEDSVVRAYLRDGVDGWRLDVAYDLGFNNLRALTEAAHQARAGSLVVGEIWNYPAEWLNAIDATLNTPMRQAIIEFCNGKLSPRLMGDFLERLVNESDYERLLMCWLMLDNHDTPRLPHLIEQQQVRRLAQTLQFTLPGAVNLYYGSELGMLGADDPMNRAPMRWEIANDSNPEYAWTKQLIALRQSSRALRAGECLRLDSDSLLAFARFTENAEDYTLIVANPGPRPVTELIATRDSKLMNWDKLKDRIGGSEHTMFSGFARVTAPARSCMVLQPPSQAGKMYNPYKRVL